MSVRNTVCIAIDGEAAAGKSTLGKMLAARLGYLYFDTGVMYRAVAWAALQRGVDVHDEAAVTSLAEEIDIQLALPNRESGQHSSVFVDGVDVSAAIREPEVDQVVSIVAAHPGVRHVLRERQRQIGLTHNVVMVGRDIGTEVMPDADLKIYLRAPIEERARRRYLELRARGEEISYEQVLNSMRQRDYLDTHRAVAPLRVADDAIVIDTGDLSIEEMLAHVLEIVHLRVGARL
ncbi:MAG: (d)CMP kinase [Ardenticatenia bacterium]|jgi:cytidylate kinase|nr:MAG: (d)CMP kinase [Ardenticatenia bacterium]